jgi:hypothetical protein
MALKLAISTQFGIDLPDAYAKISSFAGNKDCFTLNVDFYATEAARDAGTPVIKSQAYQWNSTTANTLVGTMYDWLKTQDEFTTAVDV